MAKRQVVVAALLDFKTAFDSIWHAGLISKLLDAGAPLFLVKWVKDYLTERLFQVRVGNNLSSARSVRCGVPQGSPLSPVLFIFYTSDMQHKDCRPNESVTSVAKGTFADDAVNWATGKFHEDCIFRLQSHLNATSVWCRRWRLLLNPTKCEVMLFGHYQKLPKLKLSLCGQQMPQAKSVKYLGVTLQPRLGWNEHISKLSAKVRPRTGALRAMMARNVLGHRLGVYFYKTLIESVLSYASPAWLCAPKTAYERLFRYQTNGLRAALNLPYEADSCGTLYLAGAAAIDEVFEKAFATYSEKVRGNDDLLQYIRHVVKSSQGLDHAAIQVLNEKCPAWKMRAIASLEPLQPPPASAAEFWIRDLKM